MSDDIIKRLRRDLELGSTASGRVFSASPDNIRALLDDLDFLRRTEEAQYESLMNTWKVLERFNAHPGRTDDPLHDCVEVALKARDDNIAALLDRLDAAERERDSKAAELANLQVAFSDWKVFHSTARLEAENERLKIERATQINGDR